MFRFFFLLALAVTFSACGGSGGAGSTQTSSPEPSDAPSSTPTPLPSASPSPVPTATPGPSDTPVPSQSPSTPVPQISKIEYTVGGVSNSRCRLRASHLEVGATTEYQFLRRYREDRSEELFHEIRLVVEEIFTEDGRAVRIEGERFKKSAPSQTERFNEIALVDAYPNFGCYLMVSDPIESEDILEVPSFSYSPCRISAHYLELEETSTFVEYTRTGAGQEEKFLEAQHFEGLFQISASAGSGVACKNIVSRADGEQSFFEFVSDLGIPVYRVNSEFEDELVASEVNGDVEVFDAFPDVKTPSMPSEVRGERRTSGSGISQVKSAYFEWLASDDGGGYVGYDIEYWKSSQPSDIYQELGLSSTDYQIIPADSGERYNFRVRARDRSGNYSNWTDAYFVDI